MTKLPPSDEKIRAGLRLGVIADRTFDALYSAPVRQVAERYWTPLVVARRAALLLELLGARRVLDAGSGPGKFCIAAAAHSPALHFTGIEHRPHLVEEARAVAARLEVTNLHFLVGDATRWGPRPFDAVYFFNPFAENTYSSSDDQFDSTVELSESRFMADVQMTEVALAKATGDFLLLTYYGYGGRIPGNYALIHSERIGTDWLRVWRKTADPRPPGHWYVEEGASVWIVKSRRSGHEYVEEMPLPSTGPFS